MTERFLTTVIGSMPKPAWLLEQRPANAKGADVLGQGPAWTLNTDVLRDAQDDAVRVAIHDQELAGIDIISDGTVF